MGEFRLDQPVVLNIGPPSSFQGDVCCFDNVDEAVRYAMQELDDHEREGTHIQFDDGETIPWQDMERLYLDRTVDRA